MFRWMMNIIVMVLVTALVTDYFYDNGTGFGFNLPNSVYYIAGAIVAFLPVFWAIAHVCGGLLLGIASGGVLDGLRLGILLGLGMALSKLWPASFGLAAGAYLGGGGWSYIALGIAGGILLFALDWILQYFWKASSE